MPICKPPGPLEGYRRLPGRRGGLGPGFISSIREMLGGTLDNEHDYYRENRIRRPRA